MQVFVNSPDSLLASFESGEEAGRLIIVTGPSGTGKTRWCLELNECAVARGIGVGGLVSPAVFDGNVKVGIDLQNLDSGERRQLALRRGESVEGLFPAHWELDTDVLDWGNRILGQPGVKQILILDELGPLELERGGGLTNGIALISARNYRTGCVVIRPSLLGTANALWPWGEIFHIPESGGLRTPK